MQNVRMTDEYVYMAKLCLIDYNFEYNQNLSGLCKNARACFFCYQIFVLSSYVIETILFRF